MDSTALAINGGSAVRPAGPPAWPRPSPLIRAALERAYTEGAWGQYHGPFVAELTKLLGDLHGCEAVACASGTVAVELALRGLGVGPGDEVILSGYDFKANFGNVLAVGAMPVLVDVEPGGFRVDAANLPEAVSSRTRAVLVSHLHGSLVDMPQVRSFAQAHGLPVIEDACQMPGARAFGRMCGTWGDVGVLSFGGSKLTASGRGGAVLTTRPDVLQRIRLYTQRGNEAYPLSELQAAVLIPQWSHMLAGQNEQRFAAVTYLRDHLARLGGLTFPEIPPESVPGYYKLGLLYEPAKFGGLSRDDFAAAMRAEGMAVDAGFRGLHLTHAARRFRASGSLQHATWADAHVLTLHHPVLLEAEAALNEIVQAAEKIQSASKR